MAQLRVPSMDRRLSKNRSRPSEWSIGPECCRSNWSAEIVLPGSRKQKSVSEQVTASTKTVNDRNPNIANKDGRFSLMISSILTRRSLRAIHKALHRLVKRFFFGLVQFCPGNLFELTVVKLISDLRIVHENANYMDEDRPF